MVTLYLMVGYPGSGKTTTAQIIHNLTGAVHIWTDYERQAMFGKPTHSLAESHKLYERLNKTTEILLSEGRSVIFDTNFSFRKDRNRLRDIADIYKADTKVVWLKVAKDIARQRATSHAEEQATRLLGNIPAADFERITHNLEPPKKDETPIILDGTMITPDYVAQMLDLPRRARKAPKAAPTSLRGMVTAKLHSKHGKHSKSKVARKIASKATTKS
jgi:predicted kinase